MSVEVHPLQTGSVELLKLLYLDRHLPVTKAMLAINNNRYPSLEEILGTLKHYADEPEVKRFSKENEALIAQTLEDLKEAQRLEKERAKENAAVPELGDIFGSLFEDKNYVSAFKSIKAVPLSEIETALSECLSKVCGEDLELKIEALEEAGGSIASGVNLRVYATAKHSFR